MTEEHAATIASTSQSPGSNLIGHAGSANWIYLLPSLECHCLYYIGTPSEGELWELSMFTGRVVVIGSGSAVARIRELAVSLALANVQVIDVEAGDEDASLVGGADVIRIGDRHLVRRVLRNGREWQRIQRLLAPGGIVYGELLGRTRSMRRYRCKNALLPPAQAHIWLSPVYGDPQYFASIDNRRIADRLLRHGGYSPSFAGRMSQRLHWSVLNGARFRRLAGRSAVFLGSAESDLTTGPPAYLQEIARSSDVGIVHDHWGMWAAGRYRSKKVLFFLTSDPDGPFECVVKLPRAVELNLRVENAHCAMNELKRLRVFEPGTLPEVQFFGYHAGLAVLGESIIGGVPFEERALSDPGGGHFEKVADVLLRLSVATRSDGSDSVGSALDRLESFYDAFIRYYVPDQAERTFLREQLACLRTYQDQLPTVFQHGDCGTWNIMSRPNGGVSLLDWEAADPAGLPLWDLFYFAQTYAWLEPDKDPLGGFKRAFFQERELSSRVRAAATRFCRELELHELLIEPLFVMCWMHRAVKEAGRLDVTRLDEGQYIRMLRYCMSQLLPRSENSSFALRQMPAA